MRPDLYALQYNLPSIPQATPQGILQQPMRQPVANDMNNIGPQMGYEKDPNQRTTLGWLTSPDISQGLIGAGQAILNSGYGGNIGAAFGGFNEGMQKSKQQRIDNAIKMRQASSTLGGGATGALIKQYMDSTGADYATAFNAVKTNLANQGFQYQNGELGIDPRYVQGKAAVAGATQNAQNASDLNYKPVIDQQSAIGKEVGKNIGEKKVSLSSQEAKFPQLEATVAKLSELGKKATYTYGGRLYDAAARQSGLPTPEGAKARAEYISLVDNQVLPLLRDTFGAQFTATEGESLKNTLGDPNKSPEEKDAVLRSFIDQKLQNIQSVKRELGVGDKTINLGNPPSANQSGGMLQSKKGYKFKKI